MNRPEDLPDFNAPPIDEVAVGVKFEAVDGYAEVHAGALWTAMTDQFPSASSQPPLDSRIEDLSGPPIGNQAMLMFGTGEPPPNRTWLVSEDGSELLQVQNTAVVFNWRKRGSAYPHLDHISRRFTECYERYRETLGSLGVGLSAPAQYELTYFNWIPQLDASEFFRPATVSLALQPSLVSETYGTRMTFLDERDGQRVARLRVELTPAQRIDETEETRVLVPGHRLLLSYLAPLDTSGAWQDQVERFTGRGRDIIVRTFTELTTSQAHDLWKLVTDDGDT